MPKTRVLLFLLVVLVIVGIVLYLVTSKKPTVSYDKVSLGIGTWPGFASAMVGMEKGLFGDMVVETRILDDSNARHSAFQSGNIDIMISSIDVYSQEAAQGIGGIMFLVTDESYSDGIVAKNEIKSIAELKGKKIAYAQATPSHYLLLKVLDDADISVSDIEQVVVDDPGRAGDAFLGGAVDAAVTWEPFLSKVGESGKGHILLTTKDYPDIIVDILVASDKLATNGELLKRFMDGWLKSVDFIKANPKEAAQIMSKGLNLPIEDVEGMMAGLRYADKKRNAHFFSSENPIQTKLAQIYNDASNYWKKLGIVKTTAPVAGRISPTACKYFQNNP